MEYDAVVLCGSSGATLYPLTSEALPKCLLPIANRPLLVYQLELLQTSNFTHAVLVTRTSFLSAIQSALDEYGYSRNVVSNSVLSPVHSPTAISHPQPLHRGHSGGSDGGTVGSTSTATPSRLSVTIVTVKDWTGTADAVRQCRSHILADFFLLSGDTITSVPLSVLSTCYRTQSAAVVALLKRDLPEAPTDAKKAKKKESSEADIDRSLIGVIEKSCSYAPGIVTGKRIVSWHSEADIADGDNLLTLSKPLIRRYGEVTIHTDLTDVGVYLMSRWIVDLLAEKTQIVSVAKELIPYLTTHQHSPALKTYKRVDPQRDALQLSHRGDDQNVNGNGSAVYHHLGIDDEEMYRCYAYIAPDQTVVCTRINSLTTYKNMNHTLVSTIGEPLPSATDISVAPLTASISTYSSLAHDNHSLLYSKPFPKLTLSQSYLPMPTLLSLPHDSSVLIKRSVVGRHCRLGANVKLNGCIIMDRVTIQDNSNLMETIVGAGATVGKNCSLKEVKVESEFNVPSNTEAKNEILAKLEDDDEFDDNGDDDKDDGH